MRAYGFARAVFRLVDEPVHGFIDGAGGVLAVASRLSDLAAQKRMLLAFPQVHRPDFLVHAPPVDHCARQFRGLLNVVVGP